MSYGFAFAGTAWTVKKFDVVNDAYSLCTFIGQS